MTLLPDLDDLRYIGADTAPTRFACRWHCLSLMRDFGDSRPHPIDDFGCKRVVFRVRTAMSACSTAIAATGRRPQPGRGKGRRDAIACPFHDWRWGGDGRCKSVPYGKRVPRLADRHLVLTTVENQARSDGEK
ncbi:Rieske 2Fe-2S domain-containing protein [Mycobacteroides abscessus]|uniref:Rieske 2Fe-2S domain-containing protein n=1 Tax=Mycobacteroides abscessus TaxID=36809 RepID=UPI00373FE392